MILLGARRHAKEVIDVLEANINGAELFLFDDVVENTETILFDKYQILKSVPQAIEALNIDNRYVLALGNPKNRKLMKDKFNKLNGKLISIISNRSIISKNDVCLGDGLNIMHNVFISSSTIIGEGTLLNYGCQIHHDVKIGDYCEISPGSILLGNSSIGDLTSIGSNSTILPDIIIGSNCIIGAGSVITKSIPSNCLVVGSPGKVVRKLLDN